KNLRIVDIVTLILLAFICYTVFFTIPHTQKIKELNNYKTDSIKVLIDYKVPETKGVIVNPKIVIQYPKEDLGHRYLKVTDSLISVIDSLTQSITSVNPDYLKNHPSSSKILYGQFTEDTLQLDLLKINGEIESLRYPVNYLSYFYEYSEGNFKANPIKGHKKPPPKLTSKLYFNGGYDITGKTPISSLEYNLEYQRLNGTLEPILYINRDPKFLFQAKIGYRIK